MSDVDVIIKVHTQGVQEIGNLSASLRNLSNTLRGINVPMSKLDTQSRAVNKALGITSRGIDQHAKSIKGLVQNQKILGAEQRRVATDLRSLKNAYALAGKETTDLGKSIGYTTRELAGFARTLRGLKIRAFGSDLQNISLKLTKMGKDAQFVGRSLLINLTLPIAAFGRTGLQTFIAIDREMTRLVKVSEDLASTMDIAAQKMGIFDNYKDGIVTPQQLERMRGMVDAFEKVDYRITTLALGFGVAKEMVASISADFAELGITTSENVEKLTTLTLQIEKLGNMDIGPAQDLATALYFQSRRALEVNKALDGLTSARQREMRAISAAKAQMLLFNAIENTTALTLRDLGDAFPEVASAATSFGLSMTEAAAMLAPMKAAGLDVGASANSIKVSLQRLLAPTKQNADMLNKLAQRYGVANDAQNEFTLSSKTGLIGLDATVRVFERVRSSSAGMEGALRLMSDLFEKRQGPRMYLAIEQLADFNKELQKADRNYGILNTSTASAEIQLVRAAEAAVPGFKNFNSTIVPKTIRSFKDIGNIARIATATANQIIQIEPGKEVTISQTDINNARAMREAVSKLIKDKKQLEGIDIVSEVKTEAGRALMIQLAGATNAADIAQQELDRSLQTIGVSVDKIKIAFKTFAAEIIKKLKPSIEIMANKVVEFLKKWASPEMKEARERIVNMVLAIGGFLATMGPLILALGTFQSVVGNLGRGLSIFIPKLRNASGEFVGIGKTAGVAADAVNNLYNKFVKTASAKATLDAAFSSATSLKGGRGKAEKAFLSTARTEAGKFAALDARAPVVQSLALKKAGMRDMSYTDAKGVKQTLTATEQQQIFRDYLKQRPTATRIPQKSLLSTYGLPPSLAATPAMEKRVQKAFAQYRGLSAGERFGLTESGARKAAGAQIRRLQKMEGIYGRKGIGIAQEISKTGQLQPMQFAFRGQEITRAEAKTIGRGGISGLAKRAEIASRPATAGIRAATANIRQAGGAARTAFMGAGGGGAGMQIGAGAKAFTTSYLNNTKAIMAARAAQAAYIADFRYFHGSAPGKIRSTAMMFKHVITNLKLATIAGKLFKSTLLFSGIGAVIAGLAAVVYLVIKNMDKIKGAKKAWDSLKKAFEIIKKAAADLIRPIQDLFAQFGSGKGDAEAAGNGIANIFTKIAGAVKVAAEIIGAIVKNVIQPYLYGIVNVVMAVVSIFKGEWGNAGKFIIAALSQVGKVIVNVFSFAMKFAITIVGSILKGIVSLFFLGVKQIVNFWLLVPNVISKIAGALGDIPIIGGLFTKISNGLKSVSTSVNKGLDSMKNGVKSGIDGVTNIAKKGVDAMAGTIIKGLDKGAKLGIKQSTNTLKVTGKKKFEEAGNEIGEAGNEAITGALGNEENIEDAAGKLANAIKEGIEDAAQKLYDYVVERFASALKKFVSDTTKALQKQKESALKVFDVQLNTLMKLEKAEESLTKKKEYETNRRKLIDDASLREEEYRRNRALAIYEGRIDDARILDLEQRQSRKESEQELASLDEGRRQELAKENLDALKQAINDAKDLAGKFFDESIDKFQEAAEHITRIAPVTIEQYTAQLAELQTLTTSTADANNLEFGKMFEKFTTTITEQMPNTIDDFGNALGGFSKPLDELVLLAQNKYGLGSENEATVLGVTRKMADSVIGITLGMLTSIGDQFEGSAAPVVEKFGDFKSDVIGHFNTLLSETKSAFLVPYKKALDEADPHTVFKNAITDGNQEILNSFKKLLALNPDLMNQLAASLDPAIKKYIALKAAADAAAEAAANAGGGSGVTGTGGGYVVTPYGAMPTRTSGITTVGFRVPTPTAATGARIVTRAKGGLIPNAPSGFINAPMSQAVPAILHGGEFIINASAVKKIGISALMRLNSYKVPKFKMGGLVGAGSTFRAPVSNISGISAPVVNNVSTVNIQVENFIGEEEWFESMMKSYNINVAPQNRKLAGVESRRFSSYNGINQGM